MKATPLYLRELALRDVDEAIAWHLREGGAQAALAFIDALEKAYARIGRHPASGSSRHAHALDLPGLRSRAMARFPCLVFYVEGPGRIDVWRVLHAQRDIPAWLQVQAT